MITRPRATHSLEIQRQINRQLAQGKHVERAVFRLAPTVPDTELPNLKATAFALEETYHGKKYIWGISATHYDFDLPVLELDGKTIQPVPFTAQGSKRLYDVSLFPLPPKVAKELTPLPLASKPAQPGEELYSGGYFFDGQFHYESDRIVKEAHPHRLITSLRVDAGPYREGYCGSPLVNQQGEVVGMHVGSSEHEQIGYAVTLDDIRAVLRAQHEENQSADPLFFNGKEIAQLHINEGIISIEAFKGNKLTDRVLFYHDEKRVDYNHLEKAIDTSDADFLIIHIERNQFSTNETGPVYQHYAIFYNLQSGYITIKEQY